MGGGYASLLKGKNKVKKLILTVKTKIKI